MPRQGRVATRAEVAAVGAGFAADQAAQREQPGQWSGQATVDFSGQEAILEAKGRHDPCVVPRAVPIVEGMAALVILDMLLCQEARKALRF